MKDGLSGSIVNEIEVNDRFKEMQKQAREMLSKLKEAEKQNPKKLIKENKHTTVSEGFYVLMIKRTQIKRKY